MVKGTSGLKSGSPDSPFRNLDYSPVACRATKRIATFSLPSGLYPAVSRALALIQDNDGGPLPSSETSFAIAVRWQPYLRLIEAELAGLADDRPAPEDDDARQTIVREGWHPRLSEFHAFCIGRWPIVAAIGARSAELTIADNFLADFFECWRLYEDEWCLPHSTKEERGTDALNLDAARVAPERGRQL